MIVEFRGLVPLLQVFDMTVSLAFYRDMMGFEVVEASPEVETAEGRFSHWMLLTRGGAEVMLNTAYDADERPAEVDRARWSGHGDIGLFIGCPDVDAAYAELLAKGLKLDPPKVAPYGMKQLYVTDPDGYGICLQWRA